MSPGKRVALTLALIAGLAGCRQQMANQPKYDPYEPSDFFADGMSARPRLAGTVARGEAGIDPYFETGKINGQDGDAFPFPVTADVMQRGRERFNIYCSACHGRLGDGNGMIPSRGYRRPPSYHTQALRAAKVGHFFDVMTNGFGAMPPYRTMIPPRDRWAIVSYIRALQLSQNATIDDVPPEVKAKVLSGAPVSSPASAHGGAH
jgi:mono/diheme cytochrome c family protein